MQGVTIYDDGKRRAVYDNIFVLDLAEDGRAREFTEWYMLRKDPEAVEKWVAAVPRGMGVQRRGPTSAHCSPRMAVYHATPSHKPAGSATTRS